MHTTLESAKSSPVKRANDKAPEGVNRGFGSCCKLLRDTSMENGELPSGVCFSIGSKSRKDPVLHLNGFFTAALSDTPQAEVSDVVACDVLSATQIGRTVHDIHSLVSESIIYNPGTATFWSYFMFELSYIHRAHTDPPPPRNPSIREEDGFTNMACVHTHQIPPMSEKTVSSEQSLAEHQEPELSVIPAPDLECLAPGFDPKNIQKIVREGILLATGGVAILLQVANPGVGQGVNENSNFAYRPSDRLRTTMTYVYCMAFGTPHEKATVIEMVHRAHVPVKGPSYTADDPDLQLWVAATLYAAGVDIYEKVFGKLDNATSEAVYKEYSVMATSLRVPPEMWPDNRAAFWEYWDNKIETLEITPHAKKVAYDLLYNKEGPLWLRLGLPFIRLGTAEWLPPRMRQEYGLKTNKFRRGIYKMGMGYARGVYPHLPVFIREYPLRYYMKDMRKRMRKMELLGKV
jgi:uncharacterized protein (DUF2236 family)